MYWYSQPNSSFWLDQILKAIFTFAVERLVKKTQYWVELFQKCSEMGKIKHSNIITVQNPPTHESAERSKNTVLSGIISETFKNGRKPIKYTIPYNVILTKKNSKAASRPEWKFWKLKLCSRAVFLTILSSSLQCIVTQLHDCSCSGPSEMGGGQGTVVILCSDSMK